MQLVWVIGATAWWATALVYKDGPWDFLKKFREWTFLLFGHKILENGTIKQLSPLVCTFCTGPWIIGPILLLSTFIPYIIQIFGILGIAAAVRGLSQEY